MRTERFSYSELFEHCADGVYMSSIEGDFLVVNPAYATLTGYSREELLTMNALDIVAPENIEYVRAVLADRVSGASDEPVEIALLRKDGARMYAEVTARLVRSPEHGDHLEGIMRETTERHDLEVALRDAALHDPLTRLPNRTLFFDRLQQALAKHERARSDVAVAVIDVDDFKMINDTHGHAAGDAVLVELGHRLRAIVRADETVARFGGDEFALILGAVPDSSMPQVGERIMSVFIRPFAFEGGELTLTASAGLTSVGLTAGAHPDDLLRDADAAMYRAKAEGSGIEFFRAAVARPLV